MLEASHSHRPQSGPRKQVLLSSSQFAEEETEGWREVKSRSRCVVRLGFEPTSSHVTSILYCFSWDIRGCWPSPCGAYAILSFPFSTKPEHIRQPGAGFRSSGGGGWRSGEGQARFGLASRFYWQALIIPESWFPQLLGGDNELRLKGQHED